MSERDDPGKGLLHNEIAAFRRELVAFEKRVFFKLAAIMVIVAGAALAIARMLW